MAGIIVEPKRRGQDAEPMQISISHLHFPFSGRKSYVFLPAENGK
jgi:hypothetical protein